MPLPENWDGVFWGPETMGHLLVDPTPEEFMEFLDDYHDNPAFLVGGAVLDLRLNGMTGRADALLAAAKNHWPQAPWGPFGELIASVADKVREMEPAHRKAITGTLYAGMIRSAEGVYAHITHRARTRGN
ncbi:MAG TPA: hypothetical protein VD862_01760 [Candidatus Paceibacterota bacterium]|nr:hypothetical protein [Candidatus Paceibacterota bacterium]